MKKQIGTTALVAALVLAGCGGDDDAADPAADAEESVAAEDDADTDADDTDADGDGDGDGESAGAPVETAEDAGLGEILVTSDGLTVYGFTNDFEGQSNCTGDCAETWPPVLVDSEEVPAGLDAELFGVHSREDGTFQLTAGEWPLYTYAPDSPGDTGGQGVGGVWFVVAPDGELIRDDAGGEEDANGGDASLDRDY